MGPPSSNKYSKRNEHILLRRVNSWLFTKRGRGFEHGTTPKQIQLVVREGTRTWDLQITSTRHVYEGGEAILSLEASF